MNIPDASTAYFKSVSGGKAFRPSDLTEAFILEAEALREQVREDEGGGGMCHVMSEIMQTKHGWPMLSVAYLSNNGDVICSSHLVSVLPDGSIIDWTRDQFGEGHSISHVSSLSPEIGRYRPEFYEDFYPGHPDDTHGQLTPWLNGYAGHPDHEEQHRLDIERGKGWWLADLEALNDYEAKQKTYSQCLTSDAPMPAKF